MDYQASSSGKIVRRLLLATLFAVSLVNAHAQSIPFPPGSTTTNPLDVTISVSAEVILTPVNSPDQSPQTNPVPPGPLNMVELQDAAIFRGVAYPHSIVSLLKNGSVVAEAGTNIDGKFEVKLQNLYQGTYTFSLRGEDQQKIKSKLVTVTVFVTKGVTTVVEGIFIPPTITSDLVEVKKGDPITFFGKTAPMATVQVFLDQGDAASITADNGGAWFYVVDSKKLTTGSHSVRVKSLLNNDTSIFSENLSFIVGSINKKRTSVATLSGFRKRCDLNNDNRVNIVDFSIMAFWYKRIGFPENVDLNEDKNVNLMDLSILAYCWTG